MFDRLLKALRLSIRTTVPVTAPVPVPRRAPPPRRPIPDTHLVRRYPATRPVVDRLPNVEIPTPWLQSHEYQRRADETAQHGRTLTVQQFLSGRGGEFDGAGATGEWQTCEAPSGSDSGDSSGHSSSSCDSSSNSDSSSGG